MFTTNYLTIHLVRLLTDLYYFEVGLCAGPNRIYLLKNFEGFIKPVGKYKNISLEAVAKWTIRLYVDELVSESYCFVVIPKLGFQLNKFNLYWNVIRFLD
mgnify:CR=1 FL=1